MKNRAIMTKIGSFVKIFIVVFIYMNMCCFTRAEPTVNAFFNHKDSSIGTFVDYIIDVSDGEITDKIELPKIDNARIVGTSTGCSMNNVNGKTTQKIFYIVSLQLYGLKEIVMPEFKITINNKKITVPSAKFTLPEEALSENELMNNLAFLEINCNSKDVFVGEVVKAKLNLFLIDGVKVNLLSKSPQKINDVFAEKFVSDLSENPGVFSFGNKKYKKISWDICFVSLKSGRQSLEYAIDVAVWLKDKQQKFHNINDLFSQFDSSINDLFSEKMVNVQCKTNPFTLNILPLPAYKSDDFSRSIGVFNIKDICVSSEQSIVNEPIILRVVIDGLGNFGNNPPVLSENDDWDVHQPKSSLETLDQSSSSWIKVFEFALTPQKAGQLRLPSQVKYIYFDTNQKEYITLTKELDQTIIVARDEKSFNQQNVRLINEKSDQLPEGNLTLLPIKTDIGNKFLFVKITDKLSFWLINFVVLIAIVFKINDRRRFIKLHGDKDFANIREARLRFGRAIINMERAANLDDAISFFAFAQYAIRECIGAQQGAVGMALTFCDIANILNYKNIDQHLFDEIKKIYENGDKIRFCESVSDDINYDLKLLFENYKTVIINLRNSQKGSK